MTEEKQKIRQAPERSALQANRVSNVGNDGISDSVAGRKNTYNSYITYTTAPDGQEGA